jgi:hypothetical protein
MAETFYLIIQSQNEPFVKIGHLMQALFTFDFIDSVIEKAKQSSVNKLVSVK